MNTYMAWHKSVCEFILVHEHLIFQTRMMETEFFATSGIPLTKNMILQYDLTLCGKVKSTLNQIQGTLSKKKHAYFTSSRTIE